MTRTHTLAPWPTRHRRRVLPLTAALPARPTVFHAPTLAHSERRTKSAAIDWRGRPDDPHTPARPQQAVLMGFEDVMPVPTDETAYLRQRSLPDVPPPPKRRYPRVPEALVELRELVAARVSAGHIDPMAARHVYMKVKQLRAGDVLTHEDYRVEFLWPDVGNPHYRLHHDVYLLGFADVPLVSESASLATVSTATDDDRYKVTDRAKHTAIQRTLARHLVGYGWSAAGCVLTVGGATTNPNASKRDVHRLF